MERKKVVNNPEIDIELEKVEDSDDTLDRCSVTRYKRFYGL
ncbi:MAG: hypothetical protein V5A88_08810 [Candidatus Thermoplasmatota archaeon]